MYSFEEGIMNHWQTIMALAFTFSLSLNACSPIKPDSSDNKKQTATSVCEKHSTPIPFESLPTPTATASFLENRIKTLTFENQINCDGYRTDISPDEQWTAFTCYSNDPYSLKVIEQNGKSWTLNVTDYLPPEWEGKAEPYHNNLWPIHWDVKKSKLYFASNEFIEPYGVISYNVGVLGIFELDLTNGKVKTLVMPKSTFLGYLFSFSPNGKYLAVSKEGVTIINLETSENTIIPITDPLVGNLVWSLDSTKLVYGSCKPDSYGRGPLFSSISIITINSKIISKIIEKEGLLLTTSNPNENGFEIFGAILDTNDEKIGNYYWDKGLILTATPEP